MAQETGWRPLRKPVPGAGGLPEASPFSRLALTHACSVAGDTLLTVALAGSLFFTIKPGAARGRVALYLALTMAPFAVVAPLLGRALDRSRGGRRLFLVGTAAGRAVVCWLMAGDIKGLLLFPEAFVFLVLSKSYAIIKSALVPSVVESPDELVEANSKLQLIGVAVGLAAAAPGALILKTVDGAWVLRVAAVVFAVATIAAVRLSPPPADAAPPEDKRPAELRTAGIVLAGSAMGLLRGVVGFLTFLVAFGFRRAGAESWWYGAVLLASMGGTLLGALSAPRLRRSIREEHILLGALAAVAVAGVVTTTAHHVRLWAIVLAGVVGLAAGAGKLAFDSLVQRDAPDAARGRSFARFETRFQLLWVAGAFIPVVVPIPLRVGFLVIAAIAGFAGFSYFAGLRAAERRRLHRAG